MQPVEVIIVGGGFAGLTAAAALARQGARATVFERARGYDQQFRGELIHPRGVRGLATFGLAQALFEAGGVAVAGFAVTPGADRPATLLPYRDEVGPGLGIDHERMVLTMRRAVERLPGVAVHTGARVVDVVREGDRVAGVRLDGGEVRRAALVVLADGRQSKVRARLGLQPKVTLLSHTMAFAVEGTPLPWGERGHVFLGGPGPILAYPFGAQRVRFCVDLPLGAARGTDAIVDYLVEHAAPVVPQPLRDAMVRALRHGGFESCANQSISASVCAAPGVVLVGDAGGCSHPLTASGMTNAVNDALTLAEVVGTQGTTDAALETYQRRRSDFVRMREVFTDALYEVFRGHDEGSKALQAGVFEYWASSDARRDASMNILSGEDVRPGAFMAEYTRVFGVSARQVLSRRGAKPSVRATASALSALASTSVGRLEAAVEHTARTVLDRYRLGLFRVHPVEQAGRVPNRPSVQN